FTAALNINGGAGDDAISLNSSINFASGKNLTVDLQDDDPTPGIDAISVGTGAALTLSGGGAATLKASKSIAFGPNSSVITASGPIMVEANQQLTPTSGDFVGVKILGGTVTSGSGTISLA